MSLTRDQSFTPGTDGRDKNRTYDRTGIDALQHSHHVTNMSSPSTYRPANSSTEAVIESDWPPSIRQAAEDALYSPPQMWSPHDAVVTGDASPDRTMYQAVVGTPYSFYSRSLEMVPPQYGFETFPEDSWSPDSSDRNTNAAFDNFDDMFSPVKSHETAGSRTSGSSFWSDHGSPSGTLQYHLIGSCTTDLMEKENLPVRVKHSRTSQSDTPTPTASDPQTQACSLCPDKKYTGHWAHRNLLRHMENKHGARESPDGVKHIRCTQKGCDSTFGREDARLVHERRSHPGLNTPPPKKRKRADED